MEKIESTIHSLSEATINQIAAGEVIENYSGMVKELLENSIDANSKNISVHFSGSNLEEIKIIDDGFGMSKTNLEVCYKRYYTSKLSSMDDLQKITTMGFRGEALSSIASISELTIQTRNYQEEHAHELHIHYGDVTQITASHRKKGTTITIRNLFKNVPVRKKFLKSPATEVKRCVKTILQISFSHLNVQFKVYHNKKNILHISSSNLEKRLQNILNKELSQNLIPVNQTENDYHLEGLIAPVEHQRNNQTNQFFYVNQRIVSSSLLSKAFSNAYHNFNEMKFPVGVLFFTYPTHLIDINIHPSKKEIKFLHPEQVSLFIETSIKKSLAKGLNLPHFEIKSERKEQLSSPLQFEINPVFEQKKSTPQIDVFNDSLTSQDLSSQDLSSQDLSSQEKLSKIKTIPEKKKQTLATINKTSFKYLYINQKLILLEIEGALVIVHQKRAHERILYEQALQNFQNQSVSTQQLLFPELLNLNKVETEILQSNLKYFKYLGFDIIEFGPLSFQIRGIPIQILQNSALEILKKMIQDFEVQHRKQNIFTILSQIYAKHASISNNKILNHEEIIHLVDNLFTTQNPFISPQGKQTIIRYHFDELERQFNT